MLVGFLLGDIYLEGSDIRRRGLVLLRLLLLSSPMVKLKLEMFDVMVL